MQLRSPSTPRLFSSRSNSSRHGWQRTASSRHRRASGSRWHRAICRVRREWLPRRASQNASMGSAWAACRTFTFPDKHKNSSLHLLLEMLRANVCKASSRKKLSAKRSFLNVAHVLPRSAAKQATACPYCPNMVNDKSSSSRCALAPTPSTSRCAATPVNGIPLTSKVLSGRRFAAVIPAKAFMVSKPISLLLASTSLVIDAATWD
mmetsp:Transcript_33703/g.87533  ORF Transcript_33703/g.87533 Transcript_33703/m.87533 type:complete len:206 (+) Transcript_33703:1817-2434(+)